jgi:hypothetical protein
MPRDFKEPTRMRPLKKSAEIAGYGIGDELDHQVKFVIQIAFGEPRILKGRPVLPFFHQLAQLVGGIVDRFVPLV